MISAIECTGILYIMLTIEIMGGLGNQLFQVFTLLSISMQTNQMFYLEDKEINVGVRKKHYWSTFLKSLSIFLKKNETIHILKREQEFQHTPFLVPPELTHSHNRGINIKLSGYFQCYKYFHAQLPTIKNLINLSKTKDALIESKFGDYRPTENTVSIHFRIGDYSNLQQYHPVMTPEYYSRALLAMISDTGKDDWEVLYFCEEDDVETVLEKISEIKNLIRATRECNLTFTCVDHSLDDWEQMILMSMCVHHVIANSTFSWWAAYLNENEEKRVYYPSVWFGPALGNKNADSLILPGWKEIGCGPV